jgi:hypothetical protein
MTTDAAPVLVGLVSALALAPAGLRAVGALRTACRELTDALLSVEHRAPRDAGTRPRAT